MAREHARMMQARFAASLLGLAIGDALGMPFEGMRAETIRARYGQVTEFLPAWGLTQGQYTEAHGGDTQHTEHIADGRSIFEQMSMRGGDWK